MVLVLAEKTKKVEMKLKLRKMKNMNVVLHPVFGNDKTGIEEEEVVGGGYMHVCVPVGLPNGVMIACAAEDLPN